MEYFGLAASFLMGILLGLIGGGGSILTVPIFVYLFHIDPIQSTIYSLFVVGVTSLAGAYSHFRKGNINLKAAFIFGIPSIAGILITRKFILPLIPDPVFTSGNYELSKGTAILMLFAMLMITASYSMIRNKVIIRQGPVSNNPLGLIILEGLVVGGLTGLVGAGGGFLIIPALVILSGIPMKQAVGTSLLIITVKSLSGFISDLPTANHMDYHFLIIFSLFAIAGILTGSNLSLIIDSKKLKPAFGWFVLLTGLAIIISELRH
jgi:hypothetical protein